MDTLFSPLREVERFPVLESLQEKENTAHVQMNNEDSPWKGKGVSPSKIPIRANMVSFPHSPLRSPARLPMSRIPGSPLAVREQTKSSFGDLLSISSPSKRKIEKKMEPVEFTIFSDHVDEKKSDDSSPEIEVSSSSVLLDFESNTVVLDSSLSEDNQSQKDLEKRLLSLEKQATNYQLEAEALTEENEKLRSEGAQLYLQYNSKCQRNKELSKLNEKLKNELEEQRKEFLQKETNLEEDIERLQKRNGVEQEAKDGLLLRVSCLTEQLSQAREVLESKQNLFNQDARAFEEEIQTLKDEISSLQSQLDDQSKVSANVCDNRAEVASLSSSSSSSESIRLDLLRSENTSLKERVSSQDQEIRSLQAQLHQVEKMASDRLVDVSLKTSQIEQLQREIEDLEEASKLHEMDHSRMKAELDHEIATLSSLSEMTKSELESCQNLLEGLRNQNAELLEARDSLDKDMCLLHRKFQTDLQTLEEKYHEHEYQQRYHTLLSENQHLRSLNQQMLTFLSSSKDLFLQTLSMSTELHNDSEQVQDVVEFLLHERTNLRQSLELKATELVSIDQNLSEKIELYDNILEENKMLLSNQETLQRHIEYLEKQLETTEEERGFFMGRETDLETKVEILEKEKDDLLREMANLTNEQFQAIEEKSQLMTSFAENEKTLHEVRSKLEISTLQLTQVRHQLSEVSSRHDKTTLDRIVEQSFHNLFRNDLLSQLRMASEENKRLLEWKEYAEYLQERVSEVPRLEQELDSACQDLNALKTEMHTIVDEKSETLEFTREELFATESALAEKEIECKKIREDFDILSSEHDDLKSAYADLDQSSSQLISALELQLFSLQKEFDVVQKDYVEFIVENAIKESIAEIEFESKLSYITRENIDVKFSNEELKSSATELLDTIDKLSSDCCLLQEKLKDMVEQGENWKIKYEDQEEFAQRLESQLSTLRIDVDGLQASLRDSHSLYDVLYKDHQSLSDLLARKNEQSLALESKISEISGNLSISENEAQIARKERDSLATDYRALQSEMESLRSSHQETRLVIASLTGEVEALVKERDDLEKEVENQYVQQTQIKEKQREQIEGFESRIESLAQDIVAKQARIDEAEIVLEEMKERLADAEQQSAELHETYVAKDLSINSLLSEKNELVSLLEQSKMESNALMQELEDSARERDVALRDAAEKIAKMKRLIQQHEKERSLLEKQVSSLSRDLTKERNRAENAVVDLRVSEERAETAETEAQIARHERDELILEMDILVMSSTSSSASEENHPVALLRAKLDCERELFACKERLSLLEKRVEKYKEEENQLRNWARKYRENGEKKLREMQALLSSKEREAGAVSTLPEEN